MSRLRGRHLLDHEALTCLLVLLFMDEPKLNTSRLFRVLRNLCYHPPTRTWILRALLSILQRTADSHPDLDPHSAAASSVHHLTTVGSGEKGLKGRKGQGSQPSVFATPVDPSSPTPSSTAGWSRGDSTRTAGSWLSISLEAALGCRANVFQVQRVSGAQGGKKVVPVPAQGGAVNIHPQAAPVVCRHVLDTLISLAKIFPSHFLPGAKAREVASCEDNEQPAVAATTTTSGSLPHGGARPKVQASSSGATSPRLSRSHAVSSASSVPDSVRQESDFWSLLVRLDGASQHRKGKGMQRPHSSLSSMLAESDALGFDYASCALGQLMTMLSHPVIRRSQLLTDRLLRLLGLISRGLQDTSSAASAAAALNTSSAAQSTPATTTTTVTTAAAASTTQPTVSSSFATNGSAAPAVSSLVASAAAQASTPTAESAAGSKAQAEAKPAEGASASSEEDAILMRELKLAVHVSCT